MIRQARNTGALLEQNWVLQELEACPYGCSSPNTVRWKYEGEEHSHAHTLRMEVRTRGSADVGGRDDCEIRPQSPLLLLWILTRTRVPTVNY